MGDLEPYADTTNPGGQFFQSFVQHPQCGLCNNHGDICLKFSNVWGVVTLHIVLYELPYKEIRILQVWLVLEAISECVIQESTVF
jgi:hypothetical protein